MPLPQEPIELRTAERWGLDVPAEYWEIDPKLQQITLTAAGKNWIRREAGKQRREWAKDWIAIISPAVSAVVAILGLILGLVVALAKH